MRKRIGEGRGRGEGRRDEARRKKKKGNMEEQATESELDQNEAFGFPQ